MGKVFSVVVVARGLGCRNKVLAASDCNDDVDSPLGSVVETTALVG